MTPPKANAIVIGAGPAGLTAALELLRHTEVIPVVLEMSDTVGGLSRTVTHRGYRMDLGGHRFFSRSDWVMDWWQEILPIDPDAVEEGERLRIAYRSRHRDVDVAVPTAATANGSPDRMLLVRNRLSRIYHRRRFFDYPIRLDARTILNLGVFRSMHAGMSYLFAQAFPRTPEKNLEDFLVNRFGNRLYETFFKSYTEKVWGVPCTGISAAWGAQRIKGLSLTRALIHAASRALGLEPKTEHTSLIERFLYPRLGPGQLWEEVARRVRGQGGSIAMNRTVERITLRDGRVASVDVRDGDSGSVETIAGDYAISSMPIKELVACFDPPAPQEVREIAARLPYRDFIMVGLVVRTTSIGDAVGRTTMPPDNWIYIQEPDVRLGRLQVFNNWSPGLVPDGGGVWLGLEYFCSEGDDLWSLTDAGMLGLAKRELQQIGLAVVADVLDGVVVRVPKAYPAYVGAYEQFGVVRAWLDAIPNLFLVGRNGMHRYNNQDHSMLTAKAAVDNIASGRTDKANLWDVNVDDDYLEEK